MKLITYNGAKDYGKLKHLPFNRGFKVRKNLIDSMNKKGFVVPILIVKTDLITGKKEPFIVDGQNRAITAAFLDIPFYAVEVDIDFESLDELVEYVAELNSTHKSWKLDNYVEAYAYLNYKPYKKLLSITQKTYFTIPTVAVMLYGTRSNSVVKQKIENGDFVINQLKETENTLRIVAELSKHERFTSRMVLALHYVASLKYFNEDKFKKNYKEKASEIKELNLDDYTDVFSSWIK